MERAKQLAQDPDVRRMAAIGVRATIKRLESLLQQNSQRVDATLPLAKQGRQLSEEGRQRIVEGVRRRWQRYHAEQRKAAKASTNSTPVVKLAKKTRRKRS